MRRHPHLIEIAAWPWLERLSVAAGKRLTLGSVPDREWDRLAALGFDIVYLMGVWSRSTVGRQIARSYPALFSEYDAALPDWELSDIVGSPFCVRSYTPDPRVGTFEELDRAREKLHARHMSLVLDFVANHTAFDHPWITTHPHRYVSASLEQYRRAPADFRVVEAGDPPEPRCIACGRDPHFPPWTDVAQLNYFETDTREAMLDELRAIAKHCDGVRCDMTMLILDDVFLKTWGALTGTSDPPGEFWSEARGELPDLLLIGEAYWDLERRLQRLGFSFTYDKRFTDRLLRGTAASLREHLQAPADFQERSARFLENHDEPRSYAVLGPARIEAAAVLGATVPGLRFYYDGQLEGRLRRAPVQLCRWGEESEHPELTRFYERLLKSANEPVFHDGEWTLLEIAPSGDDTHEGLVAYAWRLAEEMRVIVANLGTAEAQGHVRISAKLPGTSPQLIFTDRLREGRHPWPRAALAERGLYVKLLPGRAHLFAVA